METKAAIRERILTQRRGLQPHEAFRKSESIRAQLWLLSEFQVAGRVFIYVSAKDNEADTRAMIEALLEEGREVACPCTATDRSITWRQIESPKDLVAARYGIPEPHADCPILMPDSCSVVLVPGIAFTRIGDRIGFGAGYFDRFLAECPGISIGLCYDFQIVDKIAVEPHDIPVHIVVTETAAYRSEK
ncbi:MAG: 5-formyltetrahydrofolate cyclo-ligase [Candidatus Hydrogenedentes bacterium]|nr:5-formyltetrahydrofolate cyclo-ligase [Candidatus Hydrogenedentota bacterium]